MKLYEFEALNEELFAPLIKINLLKEIYREFIILEKPLWHLVTVNAICILIRRFINAYQIIFSTLLNKFSKIFFNFSTRHAIIVLHVRFLRM